MSEQIPASVASRCAAATARPVEVPPARLLQNWKAAHERAVVYLETLGVLADERDGLATAAVERAVQHEPWNADSDALTETLRALRQLLPERYPTAKVSTGLDEFADWRVNTYLTERFSAATAGAQPAAGLDTLPPRALRNGTLTSMPPVTRRSMVPEPSEPRVLRRLLNRVRGKEPSWWQARSQRHRLPWVRAARWRRMILMELVLIPSIIASGFMVSVLPHQASTWLEFAIVIFFGALFGWISIGFWTALFGFFTLMIRRRRFAITNLEPPPAAFHPEGRTAIVMPICEEPVDRVFAGLKATHQSLERTGALAHFDFFILSDSSDPSTFMREEAAWADWCRSVNGFGRIFYRRRRIRLARKSGNVADFCRRWGAQYRYMIMLDADSVMAGETLVRLVHMMERRGDVGMIQTAPVAVNRRSLLARVQQFASQVYGPMFAAGLHFWQLGDGQYWGHNTIIRIAPFMQHCALPRLPGKPPLGGEILSHDFVEAALMGRAGWSLWLAYDMPGSYEEVPSTLLEEMKRDRRWCQGNLQHLRLLFAEGLFGAHRALFLNGVMSYVSALLWFAFLILSTAEAIENVLREPDYFPHGPSLFPEWPIWRPHWAMYLMAVTGMILFLPKVLSIVLIVVKGRKARAYGGFIRLTISVLLEILLSSLLAPIRMVFHSRFVVQNLFGRNVTWGSQEREDAETGWREALRYHSFDTLFASAWGGSLYWLNPQYFWWVTPIVGALILSIPLSVFASRVSLGDRTRRRRLFLIPEEREPPLELRDLYDNLRSAQEDAEREPASERDGVVRTAVDAYLNALHRALLGSRRRSLRPSIRAARRVLIERVLDQGPAGLDTKQRKILLHDPELVDALHGRVWQLGTPTGWGRVGG